MRAFGQGGSIDGVWSSFGRRRDIAAVHEVMDGFGDVGRVVADALDVLGAEQQVRAEADVARVLHHVGQQLAEQRIVDGVDLARRAARRSSALSASRCGIGVEHVLQLAQRQLGHVLEAGHQRLRMRSRRRSPARAWRCSWRDRRCARGRRRSSDRRHDVAQVDRPSAGAARSSRIACSSISRCSCRSAGRRRRPLCASLGSRCSSASSACASMLLGQCRPSRAILRVERSQLLVEGLDGVFGHWRLCRLPVRRVSRSGR